MIPSIIASSGRCWPPPPTHGSQHSAALISRQQHHQQQHQQQQQQRQTGVVCKHRPCVRGVPVCLECAVRGCVGGPGSWRAASRSSSWLQTLAPPTPRTAALQLCSTAACSTPGGPPLQILAPRQNTKVNTAISNKGATLMAWDELNDFLSFFLKWCSEYLCGDMKEGHHELTLRAG